MKRAILFVFILFQVSVIFCSAQQTKLDSLWNVWQDEKQADSVRINVYEEYVWNGFITSNPDSAVVLAEALLDFAEEHKYIKATAVCYKLKGWASFISSNYSISLKHFNKSMTIYEEIGDINGIASCINNISNIYASQGKYPRALQYYQMSLALVEQIGYKKGVATILCNIGLIYSNQVNYPRALEYTEKSLVLHEELGDKRGMAACQLNIGGIYISQDNLPLALKFSEKSLAIYEEIGDNRGISHCLASVADIYSKQGNYSMSLAYWVKSLAIFEEIGDKSSISSTLTLMGNIYQKQGLTGLALKYCQRGLALAEEIEVLQGQKDACQCLYDSYKAMGNGNEALVYMEKLRVVEDSLSADETSKKLQQMEFAKQVLADSIANAKQARLVQLAHEEEVRKKNQTRNIAIGSGLLALLLAGGFYSRWRFVQKARDTISKEKDRSENLLLNILPAEIAAELKEKGRADARDFDLVSILFTDFKGFTEQSAKLSAQDLVAEINTCFETFDVIMEKHGVEKIKTIGDSYMAAGGLPVPADDSVKNTVLAAIEMQAFIGKRKAEMDAAEKPAFEMRVGIHTGPVVAGIVGVKKFQYDIWGDTVNTASRMESHGEVGKVNISQTTYELLKDDVQFSFESRGMIEAKGKGEMEMFFVLLNS